MEMKDLNIDTYISNLKEKYQKKKIQTINDETLNLYIIYTKENEYLLKIIYALL